jgi:hypothetical protein
VYKFAKNTEVRYVYMYVCLGCRKLGKQKTVTVTDGRLVGNKNPEDDHHDQCEPVAQSEIDALDIDREMRHYNRDGVLSIVKLVVVVL